MLWTARPLAARRTTYALTDLRVYAARGARVSEIALQDIGDHAAVAKLRGRLERDRTGQQQVPARVAREIAGAVAKQRGGERRDGGRKLGQQSQRVAQAGEVARA